VKLGTGREAAKKTLKDDPKLMKAVIKEIYQKLKEKEEAEA